MNQDRLAGWADIFGLPGQLRAHYATELQVRQNLSTKVQVFQAYVGALFEQSGNDIGVVEDWFGRVVETGLKEILAMEEAADELPELFSTASIKDKGGPPPLRGSSSSPNQSKPSQGGSPTSQRATSPLSVTPVKMGALALFNQRCSQEKRMPSWESMQGGEAHAPIFRATVRRKWFEGHLIHTPLLCRSATVQ